MSKKTSTELLEENNEDLPPFHLQFDNQLCFPLYSAANAVIRAYRPHLQELDLTYLQYIVLMVLWEAKSLNVKELGARLNLDSGTLTPLLKRLDGKGLVTRSRSKQDERARIITITDQGMEIQKKAEQIPGKMFCQVGLSFEQTMQMKELCLHILSELGDG